MINIAVVIPVYNRKEITIEGLKSIDDALKFYTLSGASQLYIKLIVVDDGSKDGTSDWIRSNRPDVYILEGTGNLWWSGAINLGAKYAVSELKSSHVLLWNDDTTCAIEYFYELEKALLAHVELTKSIVVSKIFWSNDRELLFNFGCYFKPKTGKKILIGLNQKDNYPDILQVDWSGGMGTLIPADVLDKVGYLDNVNFPQYDGDIDFFLRAKELGYQAFAVPTLKIFNNPETTGVHSKLKLKDFKTIITSHRSLYNLKKNISFNRRHAGSLISWILMMKEYAFLLLKLKIR